MSYDDRPLPSQLAPHYRRTNGALSDCKHCGGEGWIDCSEIGQPDVRCQCVNEEAREPAPAHRARAMLGRVVLWGLYRRALDGDFVFESWLWGAFKRCRLSPVKFMVARPEPATTSLLYAKDPRTMALLSYADRLNSAADDVRRDYANRTLTCIDGTVVEFRDGKLSKLVSKNGETLYARRAAE